MKYRTFKEWVKFKETTTSGGGGSTDTGCIARFSRPVFGGPVNYRMAPKPIMLKVSTQNEKK